MLSRRVPKFTGKGLGCSPKCSCTRTLYLGQRGKPPRLSESAKGSFAKARGQPPGTLASGRGLDARVSGVWSMTSAKHPFALTSSPMGLTPWPNHIILYIKLYVWTIPELLVMSVISYGTPYNIRSPTYITHIILYPQRTF